MKDLKINVTTAYTYTDESNNVFIENYLEYIDKHYLTNELPNKFKWYSIYVDCIKSINITYDSDYQEVDFLDIDGMKKGFIYNPYKYSKRALNLID